MTLVSPRSLHITPVNHYVREITLVFGSDGQFSLIGGEFPTPSPEVPPILSTSNMLTATGLTSISPLPNLDATSTSVPATLPSTPTSTTTAVLSSQALSLPTPKSSSSTNGDTLNSSATSDPTSSPSAVADANDHGVGAPFYLAIVLASISFIACIAAFIAWWIRSRRKPDLSMELEDPWHRRDTLPSAGSLLNDSSHKFEMGPNGDLEAQTQPYYLPASIVRRNSPDLLVVPHTIPPPEEGTTQHPAPPGGRYPSLHRLDNPHDPNLDGPSSQTASLYSRPSTARLDTGLSVQESTRTLGRLRITNRVPGDVTSGDEGGLNQRPTQNTAGLAPRLSTSGYEAGPMKANYNQRNRQDRSDDIPLEPPGPATLPWGRRTDTIAALRRTRRRPPGMTTNTRYGGYWYPTLEGVPSVTPSQTSEAINREEKEKMAYANSPSDPLGWKNSLKSSFWQAVDAMTGSRPVDPESRATGSGHGSGFTPTPQRAVSRRSSVSPMYLATDFSGQATVQSQEIETKPNLTSLEKSNADRGTHHSLARLGSGSTPAALTKTGPLSLTRSIVGRLDSLPPTASRFTRELSGSTHRRYPDSFMADTGSIYSTDSTAARSHARKHGYGDPIPSSWSALGARRDSQLDLERMYRPPLSVTPSLLTLDSRFGSSVVSASIRTRTPAHSLSDVTGSDVSTIRSSKHAQMAAGSDADTKTMSTHTMSRHSTIQSGYSTLGHGTETGHAPLQPSSSMTSQMLSRKKGVATRRKRPKLPPRAPSTASSVQTLESGLSIRDIAVKRALLERRRKAKAAGTIQGREE